MTEEVQFIIEIIKTRFHSNPSKLASIDNFFINLLTESDPLRPHFKMFLYFNFLLKPPF